MSFDVTRTPNDQPNTHPKKNTTTIGTNKNKTKKKD